MSESSASKGLALDVLGALGISTVGVVDASLVLKPRGEVSLLTVQYAVCSSDQESALNGVVKRWSMFPVGECLAAEQPSDLSQIRDCLVRIEATLGCLSAGGAAVRVVSA